MLCFEWKDRDAEHIPQPEKNCWWLHQHGHSIFSRHPLLPTPHQFYSFSTKLKTLSPWARRTEEEAPFHLSYFLGQLESPARPQSLDDMLIPDHKAIREKQYDCCHGNKAWFMKKANQISNLQDFMFSPYSTSSFFILRYKECNSHQIASLMLSASVWPKPASRVLLCCVLKCL